jgi:radical SAM protein with 4Fe4S-binding SPASM domain
MDSDNIPINKGNYSLDTPEREALFEQYRAEMWDEEYRLYRERWTEYPKAQIVSEYPLLVDAELSSLCNLRCPMCYTITEEFKGKVKATLMDFDLFKKIVDEIGGKVPALRLSLRGEPTLHPRFIDCIKYAKERGIGEVSFLTNGSRLTGNFFEEIMKAGADWITISIDGMNEVYEEIRRPLKFSETLEKIMGIKMIKVKAGLHKPVIKIQGVWPALRENIETYYNTLMPYADLLSFNPLIDYLGKDENILYECDFCCPQHYQRLVIGADGIVMMCSNDEENTAVIGNVQKQSIREIWQGDKINKIREQHKKKNGFMQMAICRKCYLPRKTEESERVVVNGHEIIIKNYINRRQNIGE